MRTEAEKQEMRQLIKRNKHEVYILSLEELDNLISSKAHSRRIKEQWQKLKGSAGIFANYGAAGNDALLLSKLIGDLGYAGTQAYVKRYGGKTHIILKGRPGLRNIFTGTKYGLQNAKVVKMGMGKYGAINAAKGGGILTIILLSAYRVIDYFLTDGATLNQLIGRLATDVVKVGIATGASIAIASTIAATGFLVAIGPLVFAIAVGVGVTMLLENFDKKFQLTNKIIAALDEIDEKGIQGIIEEKKIALVNKGKEIANDAAESVIDYAIERAQHALMNTISRLLRRSVSPQM